MSAREPQSKQTAHRSLVGLFFALIVKLWRWLWGYPSVSIPVSRNSQEVSAPVAQPEPVSESSVETEPASIEQASLALDEGLNDAGIAESIRDAEAILFVATEPVAISDLAKALNVAEAETPRLLEQLRAYFGGRGIRLQESAGTLQLVSAPTSNPALERFLGTHQPQKLSSAAHEVLAIIAYRQPITRSQIEAIRGVDSSSVVRALLARELIAEAGRAETIGRPLLYVTTSNFLSIFGLERLEDLPSIEGF